MKSPLWAKTSKFIWKIYKDGKMGLAIRPYHMRNITAVDADDLVLEHLKHHQKLFEKGEKQSGNGRCLTTMFP